jgi:hypothetical protein
VCERACARVRIVHADVRTYVRTHVHACMRASVCTCMRAYVGVCVRLVTASWVGGAGGFGCAFAAGWSGHGSVTNVGASKARTWLTCSLLCPNAHPLCLFFPLPALCVRPMLPGLPPHRHALDALRRARVHRARRTHVRFAPSHCLCDAAARRPRFGWVLSHCR